LEGSALSALKGKCQPENTGWGASVAFFLPRRACFTSSMQTYAPRKSTSADNAGKWLSHLVPGNSRILGWVEKSDRCTCRIP
jgi:hypothetical protein